MGKVTSAASGPIRELRALLKNGADPNEKTSDNGTPAIMKACSFSKIRNIEALLEAGADVNATDDYGQTAIFKVLHGHRIAPKILRLLVEAGADVNHRGYRGKTPLFYCGDLSTFTYLLNNQATLEGPDFDGKDILVSLAGCLDVVQYFVDTLGFDPNTCNQYGVPLICVASNYKKVFQYLLEKDTDIYAMDRKGRMAVDYTSSPTNKRLIRQQMLVSDSGLARAIMEEIAPNRISRKQLATIEEIDWSEYRAEAADFHFKPIESLSGIENCRSLRSLGLDGNLIQSIAPLRDLVELEELYLNDNKVRDIGPLETCVKLKKLILSGNRISDIAPLSRLGSLEYVNLYGNTKKLVKSRNNREIIQALVQRGVKVSHDRIGNK